MAHHVAELMHDANVSKGNKRADMMAACAAAIIALWEHRNALPSGARPFESLEPIQRAIASLDPNDERPRYFAARRTAVERPDPDNEVEKWLNGADGFDDTARLLISMCLAKAAEGHIEKSAEWVALAEAADLDTKPERLVVRFIIASNKESGAERETADRREALERRLARLESVQKVTAALAADLRTELDGLPPVPK
jgi:hypothetical protein